MWGAVGHEVVASVAQALLTSSAASAASDILNGQTLSDVSSWADSVKRSPGYEWSGVLHYINTPDWKCNFQYSRDCGDDACVAGALLNYTARLVDDSLPDKQIEEALKFLVHFAGDIHQPLHVGFTGDEGGNDITGQFEGKSTNLHSVWDTPLVQMRIDNDFSGDQDSYTNYLVSEIGGDWSSNATAWAKCPTNTTVCPNTWATESVELACSNAYTDQDGNQIQDDFDLGDDYYNFNQDVIDMQLARGGVRLANMLNDALSSSRRRRSQPADLTTNVPTVAIA